jgi:hypothetical protein
MKLSIAIEMIDEKSEFELISPVPRQDETQRHNPSFRASANFVAQLAATFLQDLDDRSHGHRETPGAIGRYEVVSAPASCLSGNVICRKI